MQVLSVSLMPDSDAAISSTACSCNDMSDFVSPESHVHNKFSFLPSCFILKLK